MTKKTLAFLLLLLLLPALCACGQPAPAPAVTPPPTTAARPTPPPKITPYPTATPRPKESPTVSQPYGEAAPLPGSLRYIPATPTPTPKPTPVPLNPVGQEIADYAQQFLGCDYKYGGLDPETGFDCSGLVYYVYKHFDIGLNRTAADMAKNGERVPPEELQPGDILLFERGGWIGHAGIYLGDGQYIHSMDVGIGVVISDLADSTAKLVIRRGYPGE